MSITEKFSNEDIWKGIILFGLNTATYKMALAKNLMDFSRQGKETVYWYEIAESFLDQYIHRLDSSAMPQQGNPHRLTVMERVVRELQLGKISRGEAINRVADQGLENVVPRFQTIGQNTDVRNYFYTINYGKSIQLKDTMLVFSAQQMESLEQEFMARWSLLEGAFSIYQDTFELANDIRDIYLQKGYERQPITSTIPFLKGYQGNTCFYCSELLTDSIHIDHVLPRQVIKHDEIWNLVLAHGDCNLLKSDRLVGPHFIEKLIARNENIMGSNHPWKHKIAIELGNTPVKRLNKLKEHYENVKKVLGSYYWGGADSYNPSTDPFYRRLITALNNRK